MGCPYHLFLCIWPVLAKKLVAPLSPTILRIYPVSSISSWLYWTWSKVGGRGGSEKKKRGERANKREHEKVRAISGEGVRRWRTYFSKDQVSQAALKGFFLPLPLPFAGPSSSLDILLSCLAYRSWCFLQGCPYYSGAWAALTSPVTGDPRQG